jgi:glycosyltransferase involved in cell wall biosynthesis
MTRKPIRILDLKESSAVGGPNGGLFKIAKEFARRDEVEFVHAALSAAPAGWLFDRMQLEGMQLHWIPCYRPPDLGVLRRIQKLVLQERVDLVHTRHYRGDFYVRLMLDLKMAHLPTVVTKHGMIPSYPLRSRLYAWLDRRPTRLANRVIAVDKQSYKTLVSEWKVPESRVRLIHNPAPVLSLPGPEALEALKTHLNLQSGVFIALYLGRVEADKGVFDLLSAHEMLHRQGAKIYTLYLGGGSSLPELKKQADASPYKEYIRLVETQLDVTPYLALSDLVVLPSYFGGEGLPNVLLEAMAAGKPIVATNIAGIPELVEQNVNGMMVPPKDVASLSAAITRMVANPAMAKQMGENGAGRASREFKAARVVDALINVYIEALESFRA